MSALRDIIINRYLFDAIIFFVWLLSEIVAFESCDVSSASIDETTIDRLRSSSCGWAIGELIWFGFVRDSSTTMIETLTRNLPTRSKMLMGRIVLRIPTMFKRFRSIARLLRYVLQMIRTVIAAGFIVPSLLTTTLFNRYFGERINESMMIDRWTTQQHDHPMEPPRCAAIDRLFWNIPQMILIVIAAEFGIFLAAYTIDRMKSQQGQRRQ